MLRASEAMDWRFRVALVIAHETGHRIGAIRQLRWSDIDVVSSSSGGAPRTRRPGMSTGHRSRPRCSPSWRRRGCGTPGAGTLPCCPRRGTPRAAWTGRGCAFGGTTPRNLQGCCPRAGAAGTRYGGNWRRNDGSATQGALRAGRLEDGPDGAPVLPEGDEDQLKKALQDRRRPDSRPIPRGSISWNSTSRSRSFSRACCSGG